MEVWGIVGYVIGIMIGLSYSARLDVPVSSLWARHKRSQLPGEQPERAGE